MISRCILPILATAFLSSVAQATLIPINIGSSQPANNGDGTTRTWVNTFFAADCQLEYLGKWNPNGSWEAGIFSDGSNFTIEPEKKKGNTTAFVEWDLAGTGYGLYAILGFQGAGKSGNLPTNLYEENSSHVMGSGTVAAPGNRNGWSHISFYGKAITAPVSAVSHVPDGGSSLLLLGASLLGLRGVRRLFAK